MVNLKIRATVFAHVAGTLVGGLLAITILWLIEVNRTYRYIPPCPEDSVISGYGDFDLGRWSNYECGPAVDDFDPTR